MATRTWSSIRAEDRIKAKLDRLPLKDIEIRQYVRDTDLSSLAVNVAYRVDGVHVYADILNLGDMLNVTQVEGATCHSRTLRFLNLQYRAAHRILQAESAILVDFHNQRLHSVIAKPYDDEAERVHRGIAIGQLIIDVLAKTGDDADHPAAKVRIGIDSGKALAVSNGRRGHREPLFLGEPANHAAKRASGGSNVGIYLTNHARKAVGLAQVASENSTPLSKADIEKSQSAAGLGITADRVIAEWADDLEASPIGKFEFSGHTPPYSSLDLENLSVKNSRRQEVATVYGDIDGFTAYVGSNISTDIGAKHVVRALHVLRSELDAVLHEDFKGRKVRFIGDCIHGLLAEGTAQTSDTEETVTNMTLCAAAMRSSFDLALKMLDDDGTDASSLGLQIGFEYGPVAVTRLGMKGELIRCAVGRAVLAAEAEQGRCGGAETAIGNEAYKASTEGVRTLFDTNRKAKNLFYDAAVVQLSENNDKTARAVKAAGLSLLLKPASAAAAPYAFQNRPAGPAKPDGFA